MNFRKPFYEKGKHMQEYYKIYFPYSKEYLLEQIKKTTKPLCISNQAYRDMALKRIIPYVSDMQQEV